MPDQVNMTFALSAVMCCIVNGQLSDTSVVVLQADPAPLASKDALVKFVQALTDPQVGWLMLQSWVVFAQSPLSGVWYHQVRQQLTHLVPNSAISLPEGVCWLGDEETFGNEIFVRPCYPLLLEAAEEYRSLRARQPDTTMFTGTPGYWLSTLSCQMWQPSTYSALLSSGASA